MREIGLRGVEFCPGEWDCERFESSAEPKSDACITCPKKPTKPIVISSVTSEDEQAAHELVNHIAELRNEQRAGLINPADLNALEFEMLKLWHQVEDDLLRAQMMSAPRLF